MIPECKIYSNGGDYIAIPHTEGRKGKRPKRHEPLIDVVDNPEVKEPDTSKNEEIILADVDKALADIGLVEVTDPAELALFDWFDGVGAAPTPIPVEKKEQPSKPKGRLMTKRELFDELYKAALYMCRSERKKSVLDGMRPYFKNEEHLKAYVDAGFERKIRNLIARRVRVCRKIYLHKNWNYFCTFTYDDKKHTEETFRQKLRTCLSHLSQRKEWRYIGVWERSPVKQRLHFHALVDIPDGTMPGEIVEVKDYSPIKGYVQTTHQNTYFNDLFGRTDFKIIDNMEMVGQAMQYLIKYLEKTGERIVFSKGLPAYFISDVNEEDIVDRITDENKPPKYLLFNDFGCWDEGVYMGQVSAAVIKQMRKSN